MSGFFCASVSCDMLARYLKSEKKPFSNGAVPLNFGAKFWPLIGILGGFAACLAIWEGKRFVWE
jgi:hypothetical protein